MGFKFNARKTTQLGLTQSNLRSSTLNYSNVHYTMLWLWPGNENRLSFPCCGAVQRWWHSDLTKTHKNRERVPSSFMSLSHSLMLQIIFMKCGPLTLKQANNECCRSILYPFSDKSFHTRLAVRALSSDQQSEQLCWGVSYLMTPHHTASRSISRPRRNRGEGITEIILCPWNMLMVTHLFQFSFGLPQDVPAEDEKRPGGVHQLHGAGGEDWVSGVRVSGGVIPSLANHPDRWDLVNTRLSLVNTDHVT